MNSEGYIDLMIHNGYNHLAYFSSLTATQPSRWLTSGKWEVVGGPAGVNLIDRKV